VHGVHHVASEVCYLADWLKYSSRLIVEANAFKLAVLS
jgi:hypothetical protein